MKKFMQTSNQGLGCCMELTEHEALTWADRCSEKGMTEVDSLGIGESWKKPGTVYTVEVTRIA